MVALWLHCLLGPLPPHYAKLQETLSTQWVAQSSSCIASGPTLLIQIAVYFAAAQESGTSLALCVMGGAPHGGSRLPVVHWVPPQMSALCDANIHPLGATPML